MKFQMYCMGEGEEPAGPAVLSSFSVIFPMAGETFVFLYSWSNTKSLQNSYVGVNAFQY